MSKLVGAGENLFRHLGDVHAVVILHQLRVVQLGVLQGLNEDVTGGLCIVALVAENHVAAVDVGIAFLVKSDSVGVRGCAQRTVP